MAILPTYLSIVETISKIRPKWDEPVNLDWLLQFAREGKIQLFALARSPLFACVTEISDTDYIASGGKVGRIFRSDFDSRESLASNQLRALSRRPLIQPIPADPLSNTFTRYQQGDLLFQSGDYLPLGSGHVGKLLASNTTPRTALVLQIEGSDKTIYTFDWAPTGLTRSYWGIEERDLFLRTEEIDRFLNSVTTNLKMGLPCSTNVASIGLSKNEILAAPWPCKDELEKTINAVPLWIQPALVSRGSPGGRSSLWNPAEIAICRTLKGKCLPWSVNNPAVEAFLTRYFPNHVGYWIDRAHLL